MLEEKFQMDPALRRARQLAGLVGSGGEKFSNSDIANLKECFSFFDRSGEGKMLAEDVDLAIRAQGALVTDKEIKVLLNKYDVDKTGKFDLEDYVQMMAEVSDADQDDNNAIRSAFSAFDKQEDGMLDLEEMKHVLTRIGDTLSP